MTAPIRHRGRTLNPGSYRAVNEVIARDCDSWVDRISPLVVGGLETDASGVDDSFSGLVQL